MSPTRIWKHDITVDELNRIASGCLIEQLGIEVTAIDDDAIRARMPVDQRTTQPAGVLHGGASVALAETLASWAGHLSTDPQTQHAVGQEINANHVRPAKPGGWVHGVATPAHLGRRMQVWEIRITDDDGRLVCISRCTIAIVDSPNAYVAPELRGGPAS